jgi:RPA family protein
MSATQTSREVAQRAFATEFEDATHQFQEDTEDDRAPKYQLLPTGRRANRVFVVGTLTETENVGKESDYWQARVVDPTGTFFVYAGQYQADAMSFLEEAEPPAYVSIVGKPKTYETDGDDEDGKAETYVSIEPEEIRVVNEATREQWVQETAAQTLDRINAFIDDGDVEAGDVPADVELAIDEYGSDVQAYHEGVTEALSSLTDDSDPA